MNDSTYYQKKRKAERIERDRYRPKKTISEDDFSLIALCVVTFIVVTFLFVMLAKSLENGRIECESQGGEWHSTYAGKVVVTSCE